MQRSANACRVAEDRDSVLLIDGVATVSVIRCCRGCRGASGAAWRRIMRCGVRAVIMAAVSACAFLGEGRPLGRIEWCGNGFELDGCFIPRYS